MKQKRRPQRPKVPEHVRNTQNRRFSAAAGIHKQSNRYEEDPEQYEYDPDILGLDSWD